MSIMWKWLKMRHWMKGRGGWGVIEYANHSVDYTCGLYIYISAMHVIRIACSSEMCQVSIKVKIMQARFSRARNRLNPGTSFNLCIAGFRKPESCPGAPHSTGCLLEPGLSQLKFWKDGLGRLRVCSWYRRRELNRIFVPTRLSAWVWETSFQQTIRKLVPV